MPNFFNPFGFMQPQQPREKAKLGELSETLPRAWKTFRMRADEAKRLNQWTDADAKSQVKIALRGEAAALAQDILVGDDPAVRVGGLPLPGAKTYEAYMAEMQTRFVPLMESQIARSKFSCLKQEPGETLAGWHVRCKDEYVIAKPYGNPETDEDCRDQFVNNIIDPLIATYVADQNPRLYSQALVIAQAKQGNMMQIRLAARKRMGGGRLSAITTEEDRVLAAINYEIGTDTPTTKEANNRLRNGALHGGGGGNNAMARNFSGRGFSGRSSKQTCHICMDPTHMMAQCPFKDWVNNTFNKFRNKNRTQTPGRGKPATGGKGRKPAITKRKAAGPKGSFRVASMGQQIECNDVLGTCDPIEGEYLANAAWINDEEYYENEEYYDDEQDACPEGN